MTLVVFVVGMFAIASGVGTLALVARAYLTDPEDHETDEGNLDTSEPAMRVIAGITLAVGGGALVYIPLFIEGIAVL